MKLQDTNLSKTNASATESPLAQLQNVLSRIPAGPIQAEMAPTIKELLFRCWDTLDGSHLETTWAVKLRRAKDLKWQPPILEFKLERHGGTCLGSTRAALHAWSVNIQKGTAQVDTSRFRQLTAQASSFTRKAAQEIAQDLRKSIGAAKKDPRLDWFSDGSGRVVLGRCVSASYKMTQLSRNKRLLEELVPLLKEDGWKVKGNWTYCWFERPEPTETTTTATT